MAASNAFVVSAASFASSAIDGITDISISIDGETTDLLTDAETGVEAVFTDGDVADITLNVTNLAHVDDFSRGTVGSLTFTLSKRASSGGKGLAGTGHVSGTAAVATLLSIGPGAATNGIGSLSLVFRCAAPDSSAPISWSVS